MYCAEQLPGQLWAWLISVVVFIGDAIPSRFQCCSQQSSENCFVTDSGLCSLASHLLSNSVKQVFRALGALTTSNSLLTTANRSLPALALCRLMFDMSCWVRAAVAGRLPIKRQLFLTSGMIMLLCWSAHHLRSDRNNSWCSTAFYLRIHILDF